MKPANTSLEGIQEAFHILNNFDIPIGAEYPSEYKKDIPDNLLTATQWTSVCSLNDKEIYYKTMSNSQIRKIDLKKIDFSKTKYQILPLDKSFEESISEIDIK